MNNIDRAKAAHQQGKDGKTVFDEIFDSKIPEYEKRRSRLLEEAQNISIAGTETTSWTLSVSNNRQCKVFNHCLTALLGINFLLVVQSERPDQTSSRTKGSPSRSFN